MGPFKLYLCSFLFSTAIWILLCKSKALLSDCICSFSDRAEIKRSDGTNCGEVVRACVHSFRMCHPLYKPLSKLSKEGSEFFGNLSVCFCVWLRAAYICRGSRGPRKGLSTEAIKQCAFWNNVFDLAVGQQQVLGGRALGLLLAACFDPQARD